MNTAALLLGRTLMLMCVGSHVTLGNIVTPSCPMESTTCEFSLEIGHHLTMLHSGTDRPLVRAENGSWFTRDPVHCERYAEVSYQEVLSSVTGDGSYKRIIAYNGTLPGPAIIVYTGQQVVVRLINRLVNDVTSVHFHGVLQHNTPWMDGAGTISHCSINPGESFAYRFWAEDTGTYWYHSHIDAQRTMGAYGPLIVLDTSHDETNKKRVSDPLPTFDGEFYLVLSDVFNKTTKDNIIISQTSLNFIMEFGDPDNFFVPSLQADHYDVGILPFVSALINGKGRRYVRQEGKDYLVSPGVPLDVFKVRRGGRYRFRVISTVMVYTMSVSIDGHMLNLIATDGSDLLTRQVDSVTLGSGERYDFWIEASDPWDLGNYWIRAVNLEATEQDKKTPVIPGHVEAVLRYDGASDQDPISRPRECTPERPCQVINCPYRDPVKENEICVSIVELRSANLHPTVQPSDSQNWREDFFNIHFSREPGSRPRAVINKENHVAPASPPQIYPSHDIVTPCDNTSCGEVVCICTHVYKVALGDVVQMVIPAFTTSGSDSHIFHLHGYKFEVLKVYYPPTTDELPPGVPDLACYTEQCTEMGWDNTTWQNNNVPDLVMTGAPLKDTFLLPSAGYIVIRFKADNPGFWFMHCHVEFHSGDGMVMYMQVGEKEEMNAIPNQMTKCKSFDWDSDTFHEVLRNPILADTLNDVDIDDVPVCSEPDTHLIAAAIILAILSIFFVICSILIHLFC